MRAAAWLDELSRRELRPGTWTLEVIVELCARLGDPQLRVPVVHVAGSRGKGSTCALVESALRAGGLRTGMTTSPHLLSPRERIRLAGEPVSERRFAELAERVHRAGAEALRAGYFEAMTAAAFLAFAEDRVDVAIVETGLGGRVDATNVVRPLVAAITHLGMDHADRLGGTRQSIAREKAGILKAGSRGVLAPNDPVVTRVVAESASIAGVPLRIVTRGDVERAPPTSLPGATQRENAGVALVALEELATAAPHLGVPDHAVRRGFSQARWRARLEMLPGALSGADLLVDVAHDVDGVRALVEHLGERAPAALVFSCLADKDLAGIARELRGGAARASEILVPELDGPRAQPADAVVRRLESEGLSARPLHGVEEALADAASIAGGRGLVVAFGSFLVASRVLAVVEG